MKGLRVIVAMRMVVLGVLFFAARLEAWRELGGVQVQVPSSTGELAEREVKLWFVPEYAGKMASNLRFYHVLGNLPEPLTIDGVQYAAFDIKYDPVLLTCDRERQIYERDYVPKHKQLCIILWKMPPTPEAAQGNVSRQFAIPGSWCGELEVEMAERSKGDEVQTGLPAWLGKIFERACWLLDRRYGKMLDGACILL